jgi:hypothetical protein
MSDSEDAAGHKTGTGRSEQGARLTAEAAKRASDTARAAGEAVRHYLASSPAVSQRAFAAWAASTEAALKASFGMQNAAIEAGVALSDATASGSREALQKWAESMHEQQRAMLEAFRASVRTAQQATSGPAQQTAGGSAQQAESGSEAPPP